MKYKLIEANFPDIPRLVDYKLSSILDYAHNITPDEKERISIYVKNNIPKQLTSYRLISVHDNPVGCLLITNHEDGVLLDEIYLEEDFRHQGIGSSILRNIEANNPIIYLYVYKENANAISLYKKMGFKIIEETESRFYMQYTQESRG